MGSGTWRSEYLQYKRDYEELLDRHERFLILERSMKKMFKEIDGKDFEVCLKQLRNQMTKFSEKAKFMKEENSWLRKEIAAALRNLDDEELIDAKDCLIGALKGKGLCELPDG